MERNTILVPLIPITLRKRVIFDASWPLAPGAQCHLTDVLAQSLISKTRTAFHLTNFFYLNFYHRFPTVAIHVEISAIFITLQDVKPDRQTNRQLFLNNLILFLNDLY